MGWTIPAKPRLADAFRMRLDETRVILYTVEERFSSLDKFLFVHPAVAVLLALFDGRRTCREAVEIFRQISDIDSVKAAEDLAFQLLDRLGKLFGQPVLVDTRDSDTPRSYSPFDFIVRHENVDLKSQGRRLWAPLTVNYIVTNACLRRCIYCFAELDKAPTAELLPVERVKQLMDEVATLQISSLTFSGGDPFARRDFLDILAYVILKGVNPFVSTKAHLTPAICETLREIGLPRIQVSLDSANEKLANCLTRSPTFFREICHTIKNLHYQNIEILVKAVVTPVNASGIPDLLYFLCDQGINFAHLVPYGRSTFRHDDGLSLDKRTHSSIAQQVEQFRVAHPRMTVVLAARDEDYLELSPEERREAFSHRAVCGAGSYGLTILPDGRVLFCEQLPSTPEFIVGDLRTHSIMEVWHSDAMCGLLRPSRDRFRGQPCCECGEFEPCHVRLGRCVREAYKIFGSGFAPDPKCFRAFGPSGTS